MENKVKILSIVTLIFGIITQIATLQPIVFPEVATGKIFNHVIYDNHFSFVGLLVWIGIGISWFSLFLILRSVAEILHRLPEKKEPKSDKQEVSEEEIVEILRNENHWDDESQSE